MKVKDARKLLEGYSDEKLYQQGRKLFREEVGNIITLRSHGSKPSRGVIESAISQAKEWFIKVAEGFSWSESGSVKNIIQWETSDIWVSYKMIDPVVDDYRKRARLEMLRGSPLPLFTALTEETLNAVSGMVLSSLKVDATQYLKREEFAKGMGKKVCPYGEKERFCKHQFTYLMAAETLPSNIAEFAFVCSIDKCIKE